MCPESQLEVIKTDILSKIGKFAPNRPKNELDDDLVVIASLRYMREARCLSFSQIGSMIRYSKSRSEELRKGINFPMNPRIRFEILKRINEALIELKKMDSERKTHNKTEKTKKTAISTQSYI